MVLRSGEWVVLVGAVLIIGFSVVSGVIIYVKPPPVEYAYLENEHTIAGEAIYRSQGCGACHEIFGNGPSFGPKLDGVGSKRDKVWLRAYLLKPRSGVSDRPYRLKMQPVADLTDEELDALVDYLEALKKLNQGDNEADISARHDS
ncbi:MAG TPA: cytochrome c [Gammaproteobacteria bacterium]|nr:cytochrome c [Gammaproteobacteria bacterium]